MESINSGRKPRYDVLSENFERRTFLKYSSAVGIAGLTAGCGSTGGIGSNNIPTNDDGDVIVSLAHSMSGPNGEAMSAIVEKFNEADNGAVVEAEFVGGYGEGFNTTMSAAREGDAPDIAQFQDIRLKNAIDSGLFEPIQNSIDLVDDYNSGDYFDYALDYCSSADGELLSFPSVCAAPILYYNEDALEEVGAEAPPKDPTFADVQEAAQALVDGGHSDRGIVWNLGSWYIEQWFSQQNQVLVNNANGRGGTPTESRLTSDAGMNIFEWWSEMNQKNLWLNVGRDFGQGIQSFISEDVGMSITSTSALGALEADADFNIGTSYFPVPEGVSRTGVSYGGATFLTRNGISETDDLAQAAAKFVMFFNNPEQQAFWHKNTGYQPNNVDAVSLLEDESFFEENPNFVTAFEQFQNTETTDATAGALIGPFPEFRTIMDEETPNVISSDTSVEEGLSQMKSRLDELLQSYAEEQ